MKTQFEYWSSKYIEFFYLKKIVLFDLNIKNYPSIKKNYTNIISIPVVIKITIMVRIIIVVVIMVFI